MDLLSNTIGFKMLAGIYDFLLIFNLSGLKPSLFFE